MNLHILLIMNYFNTHLTFAKQNVYYVTIYILFNVYNEAIINKILCAVKTKQNYIMLLRVHY